MKKNMIKLKDFSTMQDSIAKLKKAVKNELTDDAVELRRGITEMLDELANSEIEVDEKMLAEKVGELIKAYNSDDSNEVPAAVANAIATRFAELQKRVPAADKMTAKVKNAISTAILKANGKQEAIEAANAVAVQNGITGLEFNEIVDFAISDKWGSSNELFNALKKTRYTKFFYTEQEIQDAGAKGWKKGSVQEKEIQALTVQGKTIQTQYVYKRQQIALEDLDNIEEAGETSSFLRWINEELDRQIVNSIVATMLGGDAVENSITSIEKLIGDGGITIFSENVVINGTDNLTLADVRSISDRVRNPYGKEKWLVINAKTLSKIAAFVYAENGTTMFRSKEEVAAQVGVDKIYVTDLMSDGKVVVFLPDGYWIKEKNAISVSYPQYQNNVINYQKERNIGGGIHDLKSVAYN